MAYSYDPDVSDAKAICVVLTAALVFFGGLGLITSYFESKRTALSNQCIDAGGVPLVVDGEVKCYRDLTTIPLRKQ